ncbi:NO-inducible flavohemoprotein [Stutzerimonas stutzeri]|uniref:nitric oxide dioxygenase n=2 Tax=Gammaproteobacteria TaxID=1236 RepID=A0A2N8RGE4_STUST|nr:NO-inducible flavohemoprotein [Stutzerimonas stutzeri]MDH2245994.1 NO-inducible flavohemoprotein [Pseudomonas sp. GD03856]MDH2264821.1 NO-inducible flavohemoprotein [Pseudomonas sp. GD03855]EHY79324.1 bifunctional nitric oxide dioxygenase/dihydropteridine reductase 2 [Stutzerimonas stutzeri ATCC 14405 = CCUG 16156]MCQ4253635.1 NO-inducible flavohemoprotein [Stutzerimonas stutzeri]PNF60158.1 NO-inducible flavohemoprotein [Stutzerimonas stutzeri]
MLCAEQIALIKATVPLLESGGEALTTHFYKLLLDEHPEVQPLFNQAHQASGEQPRALANGVLMYAKHIDRLEALGPLVGQIINKHVALQVLPEHYPLVGSCLLRAIREVLGEEIATEAVIDAWGAAYQQLADILIGQEESLYRAKAAAEGGWRGARRFRIIRKVAESEEITSFHLQPEDGGPLMDFLPGQYIGLRLEVDGQEVRRNYSLSAASNGSEYRISVKREPGGVASNALHAMPEGAVLELFAPAGEFTLEPGNKPLVLISGGVGITPTLAMLEQALASTRPVHFIHCARNAGVHAFRCSVDTLAERHAQLKRFYCYEEHDGAGAAPDAVGRLTEQQLGEWLPEDRNVDAYFLGPKPFMAAVRRQLKSLGVPEQQTRYEFFGPASALD